jgi:hypothetical protein
MVAVRAVLRNRDACAAGVRATVSEAVAGKLLGGVVGRWRLSAGEGWECFELLEGSDELGCLRPCVLEVELCAAAGEREAAGDVQQPVADALGLGLGQLSGEGERLGPDEQVVREHHDL